MMVKKKVLPERRGKQGGADCIVGDGVVDSVHLQAMSLKRRILPSSHALHHFSRVRLSKKLYVPVLE